MKMAKPTSIHSSWLTALFLFLAALVSFASATCSGEATLSRTASATVPTSTGTHPKPSNGSKRIVQYANTIYAPSSLNKVHINELVNSTRPIYTTNVIYGTWTLWANKTITIDKNSVNINPSLASNSWAWDEMKTVQKAGVPVSMGMRGGWGNFNNNSTFDAYYSVLRDTLKKYNFSGMDFDIEDYTDGNPHAIKLDPVVKLIQRLRKDFGQDFVITLAPVSTAMAGGDNLSAFSYEKLEKRCGNDISWYNVQFYFGDQELASTASVDAVMKNGWKPERIVIGMMTTPDYDPFVQFSKVAETLHTLKQKYPTIKGIDGWDYYDQKPGGYPSPWEWPRWAAQHMGVANGGNGTAPSSSVGMSFRA
ncbi:glycoside hydrolase [Annulohypoxylon bovei var. microspora]|nr:glycoside hydrolase [Annulohypoxylon bovei var. microspora]